MFVAVRQDKDESWVLVQERAPDCTQAGPSAVLPVGPVRELIPEVSVLLRSFVSPGSEVIDIVGVDTRGEVTVGVCRLAETAEIRQQCVAKLLELAVRLRRQVSPEAFEKRVLAFRGIPLETLVRDGLPEDSRAGFDPRVFRLRLAHGLAQGHVRLLLAAERVPPGSQELLGNLEQASEGLIQFVPVAVADFEHGAWRTMVPRVTRPNRVDIRVPPAEATPKFAMTVTGRHDAERSFFQRLKAATPRKAWRRAERLLALGREQSQLLPAGWIVSEDALSFQVGYFREGSFPEPVVGELFRVRCDGVLVLDVPLLRGELSAPVIDALARDLSTNPILSTTLKQARGLCEIKLAEAFGSDTDVRLFCTAVRKLVLGLGLIGGGSNRGHKAT